MDTPYPAKDVAALVRSLDRKEDEHIFAVDVTVAYPDLAEAYKTVCPRRTDLGTAAANAAKGAYAGDPQLQALREDVKLMVANCIAFNGAESPFAAIARRFEGFALAKIDAFVKKRAKTVTTPPPAQQQQQQQQQQSAPTASTRRSAVGPAAPSEAELLALVGSFVRREDADAFVVDVGTAYPEQRAAYDAICPVKMNLAMMKAKAKAGAYAPGGRAFGESVADSLPQMRADVELIVDNCIRFNAQQPEWVARALSLQRFAHRKMDDFVTARAPGLRGTATGVERFCAGMQERVAAMQAKLQQQAAAGASSVGSPHREPAAVPVTATGAPSSSPTPVASPAIGVKRPRAAAEAPAPPPAPAVTVVADTVPTVAPSPLQPPLQVPQRLRAVIVADHLRRGSVPARLVGQAVPVEWLRPPPAADTSSSGSGSGSGDAATAAPQKPPAKDEAGGQPEAAAAVVPESCSAAAVLEAFRASVRMHMAERRQSADVADALRYSRAEEQWYLDTIAILATQFERLFLPALLYEREAADVLAWAAQQEVARLGGGGDGIRWGAAAHYYYLARLLVQFPQIASLCCSTLAASSGTGSGKRASGGAAASVSITLEISSDLVSVVERVTRVVQELLVFLSDFDEKNAPSYSPSLSDRVKA